MTDTDPLAVYFQHISRVPLLSQEEERELFRRMNHGDDRARDRIAEANQRLVVSIAKRHIGRGIPFADLIGEGNVGLLRAIDGFRLSKKCRLSTYAVCKIQQAMVRAIDKGAHTVRPPIGSGGRIRAYRLAVRRLTRKLCREPAQSEIAKELHISPSKIARLGQASRAARGGARSPYDESIGTGPVGHMAERHDWSREIQRIEARDTVETLMQGVTERERQILRLRYGLGDRGPLTLNEVGERSHVTRQRADQILHQALAKMARIGQAK